MMILPTLIAQFGSGFAPVSEGVGTDSATDPLSDLELIISNLIGLITVLGGIFFVVYFLLAAISWITAGGDSAKVSSARDKMIQGVIGLVILVASYAIIGLIGTIIGIDLLNPAQQLEKIVPGGSL